MKVIVKIGIETDGDFRLENYESYKMHCGYDDYHGVFIFNENTPLYPYEDCSYTKFDACWRAIRLLEHMLCDFKVIHTHHYILDYLYHIFDDAIEAIHRRDKYHSGHISGNYDGTEIEVFIEE